MTCWPLPGCPPAGVLRPAQSFTQVVPGGPLSSYVPTILSNRRIHQHQFRALRVYSCRYQLVEPPHPEALEYPSRCIDGFRPEGKT